MALLHSPELAERTAHLGSYVRFESSLDDKVIELAALASARELECKHEWAAHINHAQKAGIPLATIRAVHQRRDAEHFSFEDAQIISFVREMVRSHRVSETTFQALYGRLGERGMVELTATIGYYAMLACTLNVFDIMTATGGIQDLKDAMNVQAVPHVQIVQDVSEEPVKKRADHYKSVSIEKEKVMKLKDQVAVITGAGRNIGKAIAKLCAAEGAKIAVVEMHEGRGRAVVDEIEQAGHDAVLVLCDVAH
ncbi:MAG: SDR family NAD(P)-dependent oxidoreductase, partial [Haliea sp.]